MAWQQTETKVCGRGETANFGWRCDGCKKIVCTVAGKEPAYSCGCGGAKDKGK